MTVACLEACTYRCLCISLIFGYFLSICFFFLLYFSIGRIFEEVIMKRLKELIYFQFDKLF